MQTLSYGFQLPQSGDKGPVLFPALEANIQQLNDHTHDGTNSPLIPASNIEGVSVSIPSSGWAAFGGPIGEYRQVVSMAPGFEFDKSSVKFRTVDGDYVYPTVKRISNISYYVHCNDPSVSLVAIHGG